MTTDTTTQLRDDGSEPADPDPPVDDLPRPRRRVLTIVAAVLAAVLTLAAGVAVGVLAPMLRAPDDDSAEAGFARDMQTHHANAVEMSLIAYRSSADPEIRTAAMDITLTQQTQIGIMRAWLDQWDLLPTSDRPAMAWANDSPGGMEHGSTGAPASAGDGLMPGMATRAEMDRLRAATGRDLDVLYCQLMIRHHEAGVAMVEAVLARTSRREVRDLAEPMGAGQRLEITMFGDILKRLTGGGP